MRISEQSCYSECGVKWPILMQVAQRSPTQKAIRSFVCNTSNSFWIGAYSIETDSGLMTIWRMVTRWWDPNEMWSNNGTLHLNSDDKELNLALEKFDQSTITCECTYRRIYWKFIPPSASHMRNFWEWLIRCVKVSLIQVLNEKASGDQVLQTLLVETENNVDHLLSSQLIRRTVEASHLIISSETLVYVGAATKLPMCVFVASGKYNISTHYTTTAVQIVF